MAVSLGLQLGQWHADHDGEQVRFKLLPAVRVCSARSLQARAQPKVMSGANCRGSCSQLVVVRAHLGRHELAACGQELRVGGGCHFSEHRRESVLAKVP
jgi:hypothetical protein